jgi:hypothetical protein
MKSAQHVAAGGLANAQRVNGGNAFRNIRLQSFIEVRKSAEHLSYQPLGATFAIRKNVKLNE